ncbi:MAG: gliding motility-associated ABC transporter substrate-binding protein GldG [Bacteroidia bacterium]|nr:gliding motility-associated ABC transporter substrate-binding protein GldG [Bacteroidia bacterium]NNJ55705.1 gliding motility-associated ABC transporter substrate-binding protein GldG [Bacteroidia bacterium]
MVGRIVLSALILIVVNIASDSIYKRFDLTKEKRYTLSKSTQNLIDKIDEDVYVTIYLDGELPLDYKRLKTATRDMLNEFRLESSGKINYEFEDVLVDKEIKEKEQILKEMYQKGLRVEQPEVKPDEAPSSKYIIPSGIVFYKGQEYPLNLLKREFGKPLEQEINGSIELLEYEIGTALRKGIAGREIMIAFTEGHGELSLEQTADIANELNDFYAVSRININLTDSNCYKMFASDVAANPERPVLSVFVESLIKKLSTYSGLIIAKPIVEFTEPEKFVLDQYVMNGGKVIFLVESLIAEMDSVAKYGRVMTANHTHNLDDLLFNYGVKVQPTLIQDLQSHGIPAINQQSNRPGFWPWWFYPLFNSIDDNPVSRNLENVWGRYCSTLDTTARKDIKKTVLLRSSAKSRVAHNPVMISLDMLKVRPDPSNFTKGNQIAAVLMEGKFTSPFKYREGVKRAFNIEYKKEIKDNSMIVIGDGDLIENQISSTGQIYPLGYDRFGSQNFGQPVEFANKKFFLNCVDYLCDESNLIEVRNKEVVLRLLNKTKVKKERFKWQLINMVLPIILVLLFGILNALYRRKRWR